MLRSLAALVLLGLVPASATAQVVSQKLLPPQLNGLHSFGGDVDVVPGWMFVGDTGDGEAAPNAGAVHVYQELAGTWVHAQKLAAVPLEPGAAYGRDVAASGDWLAVSAIFTDFGGIDPEGAVHVYQRVGSNWEHRQVLTPSDAASTDVFFFGRSLAIDGDTLVVGGASHVTAFSLGAAYVFELQGGTWVETARLEPADPADQEQAALFGAALAVSGGTVACGAPNLDVGAPGADRGAVFLFEKAGGVWTQTARLVADDAVDLDLFGGELALEGDWLLVAARGHDHPDAFFQDGAVYVFERQAGVWTQTQELGPTDPWHQLGFGVDLDLEGTLAVVGAPFDPDLGTSGGSAYVYTRSGSAWTQIGKALAPDGQAQDFFGNAVALYGTRLLASAEGDDDLCTSPPNCSHGAVLEFDLAPRVTQYGSCAFIGPCGNHDDHGGCLNSTGQGGVLAAGGTTSVAADSLVLEARWLPQDVLGILFMGGAKNGQPFGDGNLAVGSGGQGVYRLLPPQSSGAEGVMRWDGGLVATSQANPAAGQIEVGDTWYMQVWYRDPSGPCGSGFNTTNALQVDFKP